MNAAFVEKPKLVYIGDRKKGSQRDPGILGEAI
jgi:hypothetical protein